MMNNPNFRNMRTDLDAMMGHIQLSPERRQAILQQSKKPRQGFFHRLGGKVVLASALAATLAVSAFAASPSLRESLQNALGGLFSSAQPITGVSAACNGIEVRPISALADSGFVQIFCEIQDTQGDRLADDMDIQYRIEGLPHVDKYTTSDRYKIVSYDEATHTALVCLMDDGVILDGEATCNLSFRSFLPSDLHAQTGKYRITEEIPDFAFPAEIPQNLQTEPGSQDGVRRLVPEQNPYPLSSAYMRISSVGFDEEGHFHLVAAFQGEANREHSFFSIGVWNTQTGELLDMTADENYCLDGVWYRDVQYDIQPGDLPFLECHGITGFYYLKDSVNGDWAMDITVKPVEGTLTYTPPVTVSEAVIDEVRVSPISLIVVADSLFPVSASATFRDGSTLDLTANSQVGINGKDQSYYRIIFDTPITPADLVSLTLDGVTIPLQ